MIADESEDFRLVLCPDNVRSREALEPIIEQHVAKGSIIHTDCWGAYNHLDELGYEHKVVNHSDPDNPFVAEDGTHTQRIESSWRPAKDHFRSEKPRHTCNKCANINNIICETCKPLKNACDECSLKRLLCKECVKRYKKCAQCKEIRLSCEKCQNYREKYAEKVVSYQWFREARKNKENPFEKLLHAIKSHYKF